MYLQNLIPLLNIPIVGILFRRSLWIKDYRHKIIKLLPYCYHVDLGNGETRAMIYINNQFDEAARKNLGWLLSFLHFLDTQLINPLRPAWNLGFDSYSSQPDGANGTDSYIKSNQATTNFGSVDTMYQGERNDSTSNNYIVIKFDITTIGTGSPISAATLTLRLLSDLSNFAHTHHFHRSKRAWVESEVTYNIWSTGNNWTTAGAKDTDDREATASASNVIAANPGVPSDEAWEFDEGGGDYTRIEAMVGNSPSFTNNGWISSVTIDLNDAYTFASSDNGTAGDRPLLEITYIAFAFIPRTGGIF